MNRLCLWVELEVAKMMLVWLHKHQCYTSGKTCCVGCSLKHHHGHRTRCRGIVEGRRVNTPTKVQKDCAVVSLSK